MFGESEYGNAMSLLGITEVAPGSIACFVEGTALTRLSCAGLPAFQTTDHVAQHG